MELKTSILTAASIAAQTGNTTANTTEQTGAATNSSPWDYFFANHPKDFKVQSGRSGGTRNDGSFWLSNQRTIDYLKNKELWLMHHGTSTTPLPPHLYRPSYTRNPGHEIEFPTCSQPVAMEGGWGWVRYGGFQSSTNETNGTNATALSDSASEPEGIDEQVILNCPVGFNGTVMLECESNQGPKPTLVADTCELLDPEGIALSLHGMDALQYGALKLEQKVARDEAHRFQRTAAGVNALRTDIDLRQQRLESDLQSLHRLANQATKNLE
jgi:hypothetical protein